MIAQVAAEYVRRGWRVVPVPHRQKAPTLAAWQTLRLGLDDVAEVFDGQPSNVGVLLGEPSGWLVDVDLDCPEALRLAPVFLPPTCSRFGRASKRASHWLYVITTPLETERFADPDPPTGAAATLVEIRSTGAQTVFPGSVHPSGEPIEWDQDGEPARVDADTLRRAVATLAAACLLARHWPPRGRRHDAALAAAGLLVRGGLDEALAVQIVHQAALAAGDDEASDRRRDVLTTAARVAAGEPVTGGPMLAEILRGDGAKIVGALRRWLGLNAGHDDVAAHCTDTGNAARFVAAHGERFRYCYAWSAWLAWDGSRWRRDAGDLALLAAKETARSIYAEAAREPDEARRKQLARWAQYSESEPGLRRMLALAAPDLAIRPEQLDADPWLLNCPNGTLELRTGHLRPHRREDFLTKMTAAPYDPAARSPVWDSFLEAAIPDEAAREFAQRYAGYCLTGVTTEEVFVFIRGPAGAGKSTFLEGLRRTLGDYACSADFSTFLARKPGDGPREDVARLAGARLVTSVETRDGQRLAEGLVKLLTGGDTIAARRLYERTFEFRPQFKLLLASNYRPRASAADDGLWRRLRELPFPTARPRRENRDDRVKAEITDPARTGAAILAWAAEGCAKWLAGGLTEPKAVVEATEDYRRSQEPLADFVAECCELGPGLSAPAGQLRAEYERWCRDLGAQPLGGRAWGAALRALGCSQRRRHDGERWWDGIALRPGDTGGDEPDWVREGVGDGL